MALLKGFLLAFIAIAYQVENAAGVITFTSSPTTPTVAENAATGVTVVTVTASESDVTYTLDSQDPNTDPKVFAIASDTGIVTVSDKTHLDFETTTSYTLEIKATKTSGDETGTTMVTVTVTDVNDAPAFVESTYSACVNTSSPAGTTVIQVTATDVDTGDTLTYSIASGDTDDLFANPVDGVIKVAAGETVGATATSYNLKLVATDNDSLSGTTTVSVTVADPCPATTTKPPGDSATTTLAPGDSATTTLAPGNSATTAAIHFHALMISVVILLCHFFMM